MSMGIKTWNERGQVTFHEEMAVCRQERVIYIPAWSSGSLDMSEYLGANAAIRFVPANWDFVPDQSTMPYTVWNGNVLSWTADRLACHLTVVGFVK